MQTPEEVFAQAHAAVSDPKAAEEREKLIAACPRHPEPAREAVFHKELVVNGVATLACQYECGCTMTVRLGTGEAPRF